MSIGSDYAREQEVQDFCKKIAEKIKIYQQPEVVYVLKELGNEVLDEYAADPVIKLCIEHGMVEYKWVVEYKNLFM